MSRDICSTNLQVAIQHLALPLSQYNSVPSSVRTQVQDDSPLLEVGVFKHDLLLVVRPRSAAFAAPGLPPARDTPFQVKFLGNPARRPEHGLHHDKGRVVAAPVAAEADEVDSEDLDDERVRGGNEVADVVFEEAEKEADRLSALHFKNETAIVAAHEQELCYGHIEF